jgi:hypothetical protein
MLRPDTFGLTAMLALLTAVSRAVLANNRAGR